MLKTVFEGLIIFVYQRNFSPSVETQCLLHYVLYPLTPPTDH